MFFVFNSRKYRIPTVSPEGLKALGSGSRSNAGGTPPAAHLGGELLDHRLQVVAPLREGLVHAVRLQRGLSESTRGIRARRREAQRLQKRARATAPRIPEVTPPINLQSAMPTPQLLHGAAPSTATAAPTPTHQQKAGLLQVRAGHGVVPCRASLPLPAASPQRHHSRAAQGADAIFVPPPLPGRGLQVAMATGRRHA